MAATLGQAASFLDFTGTVDPVYSWNLTSQTAAGVFFNVLQPIPGPVWLEVQIGSIVPQTINAILTSQINPYDPNLNFATGTFQSAAIADPHNAPVSPVIALTVPSLPAGPNYLLLYTASNDAVWQGFYPYSSTSDPAIGVTGFLVTSVEGTGFDPNNPPASTFFGVNGPAFGFRIVSGEVGPPPPAGDVPEPTAAWIALSGLLSLAAWRFWKPLGALAIAPLLSAGIVYEPSGTLLAEPLLLDGTTAGYVKFQVMQPIAGNVSVGVPLVYPSQNPNVYRIATAYLMTNVGPSATEADLIASRTLTPQPLDNLDCGPLYTAAFSVPLLAPGTYYFVVYSPGADVFWQSYAPNYTIAADPRVTPGGIGLAAFPYTAIDTLVPYRSEFLESNLLTYGLRIADVPEPATGAFAAVILFGLAAFRNRRMLALAIGILPTLPAAVLYEQWDPMSQFGGNVKADAVSLASFRVNQAIASPLTIDAIFSAFSTPLAAQQVDLVLTKKIGPSAAAADIVATVSLMTTSDPILNTTPPYLTAFALPSLAAGDYFIVASSSGTALWRGFDNGIFTTTTSPEISPLGFGYATSASSGFNAAEPYRSVFTNSISSQALGIRITTTDATSGVPEPSALALTALGVTALLLRRKRR